MIIAPKTQTFQTVIVTNVNGFVLFRSFDFRCVQTLSKRKSVQGVLY